MIAERTNERTNDNNNFIYIRQATKLGFIPMISGNVADLSYPTSKIRRGRVQGKYGDISPTITCGGNAIHRIYKELNMANEDLKELNQSVKKQKKQKYRIRKITPKECFRLQGVTEKDADAMLNTESNSQCYKAAGNSITVSTLCALFLQLGIQEKKRWNEMSLEEKKKTIYKGTILENRKVDFSLS